MLVALRDRSSINVIIHLALGSLMLNTLPVLLVEASRAATFTASMIGHLATLLLVACMLPSLICKTSRMAVSWLANLAIVFLVVFGSTAPPHDHVVVYAGSALFGLAVGYQLFVALNNAEATDTPEQPIALGISLGFAAAVIVLGTKAALGWSVLFQFAICSALISAVAVMLPWRRGEQQSTATGISALHAKDLAWMPFFIMTGSYWAFIEIYASENGVGGIAIILMAALLVSMIGSMAVPLITPRFQLPIQIVLVFATAASGAATYLLIQPMFFTLALLLNSVSLFTLLPLYLGVGSQQTSGLISGRLAIYLAGLALGGTAGAQLHWVWGFNGIAIAIALSALPAIFRSRAI